MDIDQQVRLATFDWLSDQVALHGDVLPRKILEDGFDIEGQTIHLVGPQGIFKPRILEIPLTITTTPGGPYEDSFSPDEYLLYRYRGTDPNHPDNVGLRRALTENKPLVYFHGVVPGKYLAVWPVFIIADQPDNLAFKVAVDDMSQLISSGAQVSEPNEGRRAYITATVLTRLHQRSFRERVLEAYSSQCALCRLRHLELLDAAHIIPDSEPTGTASVNNGIALCKLHHAAFDRFIIGITPDYIIEVRQDILDEEDGPMLQHGLKDLHQSKIILPKNQASWPNRNALDDRYQRFRAA